jgi:hypothetical protein
MVTDLEVDELEPKALVAITVNVYFFPLVRFVTRWLRELVPALPSTPPLGFEVTV